LQSTHAAQPTEFEEQLEESRRAMDRNAAHQADYETQLEQSRQSAARHEELLSDGEQAQVRQDAQFESVDELIGRWAALADRIEGLLDDSGGAQ
jgi:hypothetical protein